MNKLTVWTEILLLTFVLLLPACGGSGGGTPVENTPTDPPPPPPEVIYFPGNDGVTGVELWKTDGTAEGTQLVSDINSAGDSWPLPLATLNGTSLFIADDGVHGVELWRSDGTSAGTSLVKDINPAGGIRIDRDDEIAVFNGRLYFSDKGAISGASGALWVSDGTTTGTNLLKEINTAGDANIAEFVVFKNSLFFEADDGTSGSELWISDGTASGTQLFKDINPGAGSATPFGFVEFNGKLLFAARDDLHGIELWSSDGTPQGTALLKNINPDAADSWPAEFTQVGNMLYFRASNGIGKSLWKTDGTADGTQLVKQFEFLTTVSGLADFNGELFFVSNYLDSSDRALWRSDGTDAGTNRLKDIYPTGDDSVLILGVYKDHLYFRGDDGVNGVELWRSDGTPDGTQLFKDINQSGDSYPYLLDTRYPTANDVLIFTASDGVNGNELWRSDGTTDGTMMYLDINLGSASGVPD